MKAVFCIYDGAYTINGINAWMLRLLPALKDNGIDVNVICIAWAKEDECTVLPQLKKQEVKYTIIPPVPAYTETQVRWILNYVNQLNPDVFVAGNMTPALHACKWIKAAGIATIAVLHNDDSEHDAILKEFIEPQDVDAVVAVSALLYKGLLPYANRLKTYRIPCGSPVPDSSSRYLPGNTFKTVYIGRLIRAQKNIDKIAAGFCLAAIQIPDTEFYIYGSGPDDKLVEKIIADYGSPANVFYKKSIANSQVQEILLQSHCFVLMSDHEGIPVALMEAMACGVVPVCINIQSGIPELVADEQTGLLMDEPDLLPDKIRLLKNNPALWERLSVNSKQLIADHFSAEKNLDLWLNLLNDFSGRSKRRIKIPVSIKLPPQNLALAGGELREPSLLIKIIRKLKRLIVK